MENMNAKAQQRVKCHQIMTKNVATATRGSSLRKIANILKESDIGILPIVDEDTGRLVGLVTDRDIVVRAVANGMDSTETAVSEIMTKDLFTVGPDDFAFRAIRLMGEKQVRRVPIVDEDGVLKGIVSMADVALEMEDEREIAETLEEISSGVAFWNKN